MIVTTINPTGHDPLNIKSLTNSITVIKVLFSQIYSACLEFVNTDSASRYMRLCRKFEDSPHPARYPIKLSEFFITS